MKTLKKVPRFKSEIEESNFWSKHDLTEYFDLSKAKPAKFPNLKPSTKLISIRLPESLIEDIKILANRNDVPYQSLIKLYLADSVKRERRAN